MFPELLIAFLIFTIAFTGMAIGVIISRKCLQGTCGGLANWKDGQGGSICDACTSPSPDCPVRPDANHRDLNSGDEKIHENDSARSLSR